MLHGRVDVIDAASAIVEVGGVGYELRMPSADLASMHAGQTVKVYTSLSVSQDAITLFGFSTAAAKRMFLQLQKVSGIGPKVALSLLSTLPTDRLARAVADGDATALSKAPGLGKKGAQKIILELKGSIDLNQIEGAADDASEVIDAHAKELTKKVQSLEKEVDKAKEEIYYERGFRKFFFWLTPVLLIAQGMLTAILLLR